jgi:hypothetical protein
MDDACNAQNCDEETKLNLKVRDHFGDLGVNGTAILEKIFKLIG